MATTFFGPANALNMSMMCDFSITAPNGQEEMQRPQ